MKYRCQYFGSSTYAVGSTILYSLIYLLFSFPYSVEVVVPNRIQFLGATAGAPTPFSIIIGYSMSPKSGCGQELTICIVRPICLTLPLKSSTMTQDESTWF